MMPFMLSGSLSPDALRQQLDLAEANENAGDIDGAGRILDDVIERAPDLALPYYRRGLLRLFDQEAYAGALADLTRAEAHGITSNGVPSAQLDYAIGEALFRLEGYIEAAQRLRRAAGAETDLSLQAESYYRLAECADEFDRDEDLESALVAFLARRDAFLESGGDAEQLAWAEERLAEVVGGR